MEEIQKQFNPEWFHDVLFLHTPHPPTVRQLAQLMNSISMVSVCGLFGVDAFLLTYVDLNTIRSHWYLLYILLHA